MSRSFNFKADLAGGIALIAFFLSVILSLCAGWATHVIWTFNQETVVGVLLGILGCFVAPIGALHGIYTWF